MISRAESGSWSLIEMPTARTLPEAFSSSKARRQSSAPIHSGFQTWSCSTSMASRPRLSRLCAAHDVVVGENLADGRAAPRRPDGVLRRHLGGDKDAVRRLAHHLPDEPLAVPFAVGERGIDEIDPELDGTAEGLERFVVRPAEPLLAADAPCAVADFADGKTGASESAVFQETSLRSAADKRRLTQIIHDRRSSAFIGGSDVF